MSKLTLATDVATALGTTLVAALKKIDVDEAKKIVSEATKKINSGISNSDIRKVAKPKINSAPKLKKVPRVTKKQQAKLNQRQTRGKQVKEDKKVADKTASDKKIKLAKDQASEKFDRNFWTGILSATGMVALYKLLTDEGKDPNKMTNNQVKNVVEKTGKLGMMGGMGDPGGLAKAKDKPAPKSNKVPNSKEATPPIPRKKPTPPKEMDDKKFDRQKIRESEAKASKKAKRDKILKEEGRQQQGQLPKKSPKKKGRFEQERKDYKTPFGTLTVDSTDRGMSKFGLSDNWKELEAEEEMNFRRGGMPRSRAFGKGGMYKTPKKAYGMKYGGVTRRLKG